MPFHLVAAKTVVNVHTFCIFIRKWMFHWNGVGIASVCGFSNIHAVFYVVNDYFEFRSVAHIHIGVSLRFWYYLSRAQNISWKEPIFLIAEQTFFSENVITLPLNAGNVCHRVHQNHISMFLIQRESKIHTICRWLSCFNIYLEFERCHLRKHAWKLSQFPHKTLNKIILVIDLCLYTILFWTQPKAVEIQMDANFSDSVTHVLSILMNI